MPVHDCDAMLERFMQKWLFIIPGAIGALVALQRIAATSQECTEILNAYEKLLAETRQATPPPKI